MGRYVVLDVETPNQHRICSIGITVIEDDVIGKTISYLVNPECEFNKYTIDKHGIHPEDVFDAPTFDKIWPEISGFFYNNIIVGHNVRFDLSVLHQTLTAYNIEVPELKWICTQKIAERVFDKKNGYGLKDLCQHFDIPITHHNSGSDSRACAELFLIFKNKGLVIDDEAERFIYQDHSHEKNSKRTIGVTISLPAFSTSHIPYTKTHNYSLNTIKDKTFVVSGDFEYADKETIEELLKSHGARIVERVSKKVDVVLVGALGNPKWKNGNYGNKIKDAMDLKSKGHNIDIISEYSFEFSEVSQ